MKFRRSKSFNTKEVVDVVIAALAIKNAPRILGLILPVGITTGLSGNITGGAVGYVVGALLKKPLVKTVSIALTAANIVQDIAIGPALSVVGAGATPSLQANTRRFLGEYTRAPRSARNYAQYYNN